MVVYAIRRSYERLVYIEDSSEEGNFTLFLKDWESCMEEKPTNEYYIQESQSQLKLAQYPKPIAFKIMLLMGTSQ